MAAVRGGTQQRPHMNQVLPANYFTRKRLVSLLGTHQ